MSDARPFRFGLAVTGGVSSREEWIGLARRAEDMGYATLLVADHYVNEYLPIAALMAAADATSTLRVGSYVFNNDFRHPVQLAKEVAALDRLSGGRFELNLLIRAVILTEDRQQAAEKRAREQWTGETVTAEEILANPYLLIGPVEHVVEALLRRRERFGISYLTVHVRDAEVFAPVVAHLAGL